LRILAGSFPKSGHRVSNLDFEKRSENNDYQRSPAPNREGARALAQEKAFRQKSLRLSYAVSLLIQSSLEYPPKLGYKTPWIFHFPFLQRLN